MKYIHQLKAQKIITAVEPLDLRDAAATLPNELVRTKVIEQLTTVEVYRIVYTVNKLSVVGYIALPKTGTDLPCLMHLRGGSKDFGMVTPQGILGNLVNYAAAGYVVITTQYPGVEGGDGTDAMGGEDDMESIKKLRTILQKIDTIDIKRLGVKGHSRGGLMTLMLLREVKWIKAAMVAGAPIDQVNRTGDREGWRDHQIEMWGGSRKEAIKRSPIRWAEELPKKVPILIMHGGADWRVLPRHSYELSQKCLALHIPHRFIMFEGADHGLTEHRIEYHRQTLEWFGRFLKNDEPLPNLKPHGK
jgi:dipeptidyl aminopeptidase/acylaminoacyl peptidase